MRVTAQPEFQADVAETQQIINTLRTKIEELKKWKVHIGYGGIEPYAEMVKHLNGLERQLDMFEWTYEGEKEHKEKYDW
jgi:hypothetical protein